MSNISACRSGNDNLLVCMGICNTSAILQKREGTDLIMKIFVLHCRYVATAGIMVCDLLLHLYMC